MLYRRALLNPLRYGFYAWQLFSHKVLRRLVGVPLLVMALVTPWLWHYGIVYQAATVVEAIVVAAMLTALLLRGTRFGKRKPWSVLWYFLMVNTAALVAVMAILRGQRIRRWEPERHQLKDSPSDGSLKPMETAAS